MSEEIKQETEQVTPETEAPEEPQTPAEEVPAEPSELEKAQEALKTEHDNYLRLAAEYDNFRKRSKVEKDNIGLDTRAKTAEKFLPVYDNLERALQQQTTDEAFKKGVEMTMTQLVAVLESLDVKSFGTVGDAFDPNYHNAIRHVEDENFAENTICQVFQTGFKLGEKVIRYAMVVVAN